MPSLVDCIFSNEEFLVCNFVTLVVSGKSHHVAIFFNRVGKTELKHPTYNGRRRFKRLDGLDLEDDLRQMDRDA